MARLGLVWRGRVRRGGAGLGLARRGMARRAGVRHGTARFDVAQEFNGGHMTKTNGVTTTLDVTQLAVDEAQITNGAKDAIEQGLPYRLSVGIVGTAPLLFHAWNVASVAEKAASAKGSKAKKSDDLESYCYRDEHGHLGVPGQNFAASIQQAGRYMQDPRSPRKSALDLCKAGVVPLTPVATFEPLTAVWDFEHAARVTVQRAGITRVRPAMREGWRLTFDVLITTPEYLSPATMAHLIGQAGRLVGLCDFRPTYGRFAVSAMDVLEP